MGKIRRKFEVEFKRRLVEQIETGQMTLSAAVPDLEGILIHVGQVVPFCLPR